MSVEPSSIRLKILNSHQTLKFKAAVKEIKGIKEVSEEALYKMKDQVVAVKYHNEKIPVYYTTEDYDRIKRRVWNVWQKSFAATFIYPNAVLDIIDSYIGEKASIKDLSPEKELNNNLRTLTHDLAVQKSLLLKQNPKLKNFAEILRKQVLSFKEQVQRLRLEAYTIENPEYTSVLQAFNAEKVPLDFQLEGLRSLREYAFGTDKWIKYFGPIEGNTPNLPMNIFSILITPDPIDPTKTIKDNYVLVLVPEAVTVDDKRINISLESLRKLSMNPKQGHALAKGKLEGGESSIGKPGFMQLGACTTEGQHTKTVEHARWVLMRKNVLPGSVKKEESTLWQHINVVEEASKRTGFPLLLPNAIDATACCLLTYISTKEQLFYDKELIHRIYSYDPEVRGIYTACQDVVAMNFMHIGFDCNAFDIMWRDDAYTGATAVLDLKVLEKFSNAKS